MSKEETTKEIIRIFNEIFPETNGNDLNLNKNQGNFENWDSFTHMDLVRKVEERFSISLDLNDVVELDTPQKFVDIVIKKGGKKC